MVVDLLEAVKKDLAAFADPATPMSVDRGPQDSRVVTWQQSGRLKRARFLASASIGDLRVLPDGFSSPVTYPVFLASAHLADLRTVARNTLNVIKPVRGYVAPRLALDGQAITPNDLFNDISSQHGDGTRFLFVTGDAGAGKSSLLTQLTRRSADLFVDGESPSIWLYVNAQGSRLARLDQALAEAIDRVRAPFPYFATSALVRAGVVTLVVDGFDELIGTTGSYDEAYSSLASFIAVLDGRGTVVAAARSAYYEQEFVSRAGRATGFATEKWDLQLVSLTPWSIDDRSEFLRRFFAASPKGAELADDVSRIFLDPSLSELAVRPLFVARVAELRESGATLSDGEDLLDRLISTYLRREADTKLLSARGSPLLTPDQLAELYAEVANELWRQEARELSRTSLRELVLLWSEIVGLPDPDRELVAERFPYAAMMRSGSTEGSVSFEHELYFAYFLARSILVSLLNSGPTAVGLALRKGRLPARANLLIGRGLVRRPQLSVLDALSNASSSVTIARASVRENAGLIVAGIAKLRSVSDAVVSHVDFLDCELTDAMFERCAFSDCTFRGSDLSGARFSSCTAEGVVMDGVRIDSRTLLDVAGLEIRDFIGLVASTGKGTGPLFGPEELSAVLSTAGLPAAQSPPQVRAIDAAALRLVDALARLFERTNIASEDDDNAMRRIVSDPAWSTVRDALVRSEVMREEVRSAHGRKVFLRLLVRPADLLAGQVPGSAREPRIAHFWKLLEG